jgi:pseudouridine-5'-monophosphatase
MTPTHVIFDLDGTLLDTEPIYTVAAQAVVGRFGKVYDWSVKRHVVGGDPMRGARFIVEHLQLPMSAEQYIEEREGHMRELCKTAPAKAGAERLIEALHARGIPMSIGTSSQRELAELKLGSHTFTSRFAHIVCSDDPGITSGKPSPDIFLRAARLMNAEPADCLVFEDTPKGVEAARNAGMRAIAVPDPEMRDSDFSHATLILDSLEAITLAQLGL